MQQIDVEMDTGRFFCPVTGQLICDGDGDADPSPATKFVFLNEIDDFTFVAKDLKSLLKKARADVKASDDEGGPDSVFEHFLALVDAAGAHPDLVAVVIRTNSFACGPVSSICKIGIDMAHADEG